MREHGHEYETEAMQELFAMEPDNDLTPVQMMRRSLFPRWEIIRPALFDPVAEEDRQLAQLVELTEPEQREQHPGH